MKTTLCLKCEHGLIREWEDWNEVMVGKGIQAKCLLSGGNDFVECITSCNKFKRMENKVTYHDPDFSEYEKKIEQGEDMNKPIFKFLLPSNPNPEDKGEE